MADLASEVAVYKEQLFVARQQLARQTNLAEEQAAAASEARRESQVQAGRLAQLEHDVRELHDARQRCEELQGTVEALQQEAHRLKSARAVLDSEVADARSAAEARARELSQLQGSAALNKARVEEQGGQIRLLKQQLVDLEDEVRRWRRIVRSFALSDVTIGTLSGAEHCWRMPSSPLAADVSVHRHHAHVVQLATAEADAETLRQAAREAPGSAASHAQHDTDDTSMARLRSENAQLQQDISGLQAQLAASKASPPPPPPERVTGSDRQDSAHPQP